MFFTIVGGLVVFRGISMIKYDTYLDTFYRSQGTRTALMEISQRWQMAAILNIKMATIFHTKLTECCQNAYQTIPYVPRIQKMYTLTHLRHTVFELFTKGQRSCMFKDMTSTGVKRPKMFQAC